MAVGLLFWGNFGRSLHSIKSQGLFSFNGSSGQTNFCGANWKFMGQKKIGNFCPHKAGLPTAGEVPNRACCLNRGLSQRTRKTRNSDLVHQNCLHKITLYVSVRLHHKHLSHRKPVPCLPCLPRFPRF